MKDEVGRMMAEGSQISNLNSQISKCGTAALGCESVARGPLAAADADGNGARRVVAEPGEARLFHWGLRDYGEVLALQERLRAARRAGAVADTWLAGEHPTVITQGVRGRSDDLVMQANPQGWPVYTIDRGGMTTLHNPGQLVIYPIVRVPPGVLAQARMARVLLVALRDWLAETAGVALEVHKGRPGLFHGERKAAAIGISIHGGVTMHGVAINLCNDLSPWRAIVPCGEPTTRPVTLSEILGRPLAPADLIPALPAWLERAWGYERVSVVPNNMDPVTV